MNATITAATPADTPTTVALIFALAGAVFVGIYIIRRLRRKDTTK